MKLLMTLNVDFIMKGYLLIKISYFTNITDK